MSVKHEFEIREQDYQEGYENELNIFDKLRNKGFSIEETDRYEWYDMKIDNEYLGEIKKRVDINKDTYDTTIFPFSKIREWKKVRKDYNDLILIFSFKDNDYYISYKELREFKKTDTRIKVAPFQRYKGFIHKSRLHYYVPIDLLKPLDNLILS